MIVKKKDWKDLNERLERLEDSVGTLMVERFYNQLVEKGIIKEEHPNKKDNANKEEKAQEPKKRGRKPKKEVE